MRGKIGRRLARVIASDRVSLDSSRAVLTMTFDDVPRSACTLGRDILKAAGARATYYVSGGFEQGEEAAHFHTADLLRGLVSEGHEIGCHGFDHLNYQEITTAAIAQDIERNRAYFDQIGVPPAASFAYPYGCVDPRVKRRCAEAYRLSRGITAGINRGRVDLRLIKAVPLYAEAWSERQTDQLLMEAKAQGGWVVFFTHGVTDTPGPFDTTPALLQYTVERARALEFDILPLAEAVKELEGRG